MEHEQKEMFVLLLHVLHTLSNAILLLPGAHELPIRAEGASKYIDHQLTKPEFKDHK